MKGVERNVFTAMKGSIYSLNLSQAGIMTESFPFSPFREQVNIRRLPDTISVILCFLEQNAWPSAMTNLLR